MYNPDMSTISTVVGASIGLVAGFASGYIGTNKAGETIHRCVWPSAPVIKDLTHAGLLDSHLEGQRGRCGKQYPIRNAIRYRPTETIAAVTIVGALIGGLAGSRL